MDACHLTHPSGPHAGHVDWGMVSDLNLSGCGLKEMTYLDKFRSLVRLKMDHNVLTDLNGVQGAAFRDGLVLPL